MYKEREEYEMKYFMRMPLTKKDMVSSVDSRVLSTTVHFGVLLIFTGTLLWFCAGNSEKSSHYGEY